MACLLQLQQGGYLAKQDNAGFLLLNVCDDIQGGGGKAPGYKPVHVQRYEWQMEQKALRDQQDKLEKQREAKERQIEALEEKRKKDLADQKAQQKLIALMAEAYRIEQEEIAILARLRFLMQQEEDILILLYSLPFVS